MTSPTEHDRADFRRFCEQASDRQLPYIYEKERAAGRRVYAAIVRDVMRARGLDGVL